MASVAVSSRLCALLFSFSASFAIDSVPFVPFPNANDPKTLARRPPEPEDPFLPAPADDAKVNALFDRGRTRPQDFVERSDGFAEWPSTSSSPWIRSGSRPRTARRGSARAAAADAGDDRAAAVPAAVAREARAAPKLHRATSRSSRGRRRARTRTDPARSPPCARSRRSPRFPSRAPSRARASRSRAPSFSPRVARTPPWTPPDPSPGAPSPSPSPRAAAGARASAADSSRVVLGVPPAASRVPDGDSSSAAATDASALARASGAPAWRSLGGALHEQPRRLPHVALQPPPPRSRSAPRLKIASRSPASAASLKCLTASASSPSLAQMNPRLLRAFGNPSIRRSRVQKLRLRDGARAVRNQAVLVHEPELVHRVRVALARGEEEELRGERG